MYSRGLQSLWELLPCNFYMHPCSSSALLHTIKFFKQAIPLIWMCVGAVDASRSWSTVAPDRLETPDLQYISHTSQCWGINVVSLWRPALYYGLYP